ncbi:SWEET sugar transporter [Phytophthora cactorum]|nr:SWEET sugar transporter [Phytophthora cactorum]
MSSSILLVLSTGAAILAVLAPFPDFWRIYKTRSTGSVSVLPVVLIFCNCYAWVILGTSGATNQSSEAVENTLGAACLYWLCTLRLWRQKRLRDEGRVDDSDHYQCFFLANGIVWEVHSIRKMTCSYAIGVALCVVQ